MNFVAFSFTGDSGRAMLLRKRWFCTLLAGALVAGMIFVRAQLPRATIALEAGSPRDFMFLSEQREIIFLPDSSRLITRDWPQIAEGSIQPEHFRMRLWDARTGQLIASLVEGSSAEVRAWSPEFIAAEADNNLLVWNAADGKLVWQAALTAPACFFEGDQLIAFSTDSPELIDLKTGQAVRVLDCDFWQDNNRRWRLARPCGICSLRNPTRLVDLHQGKVIFEPSSAERPRWEGMTPDGRFFWYTTDHGELVVWHVAAQKERRHDGGYRSQFMSFHPDGETVAIHCEPDLEQAWLGRLRNWGVPVDLPVSWVAVFDARTDRDLFMRKGAIFGVFSPDGQTLAILREDYIVELWDWPTGTPWLRMLGAASLAMMLAYGCLRWRDWHLRPGENRP
jgi:WD40 repeat protein